MPVGQELNIQLEFLLDSHNHNMMMMGGENASAACNGDISDASRRVKVCDSRRKQKWIESPTPIPPTPPRSPSIPEPLLDELLELWVGMDEPNYKLHDISLKSALDSLDFDDDGNVDIGDENGGDLETGQDDEELLDRLLKHPFDDSPPPTNPASPREMSDQDVEIQSEAYSADYSEFIQMSTETVVSSSEENDTDMELEEFDRFPKTEPITSEFSSHMFDSYFSTMITVDEKPPALLTEGDSDDSDSSEAMSAMINYGRQSFSDDVEIKHDCMWAGSCESDSHQDVFEELFGTSLAPRLGNMYADEDEEYDITNPSESTSAEADEEVEGDLEEESNLEILRSKILGDHSYAFNGYGPLQSQQQPNSQSNSQSTSSIFSSSAQTSHAIPGILLKQEESSSPKKTKIIVPLKDLMETLKQKSFLVAPLGPGKNVIRLTGSGETVKGVFDLGAKIKSASMSSTGGLSLSSSGSFSCSSNLSNGGKGSFNSKKSSPKLKKAVHKPKQELSPCSPLTSNSRNSSSPSHFNQQHSNSNSSSSSNSNNSHPSSANSPLNISSSSNPSSTTPSGKPRKAKTHNNMERMRRIDLRNSFDTLRKLVPVLTKANKCSKVEILKSATEYINGLKVLEKRILREEYSLKSRNESLRNKLALLTSSSTST